MVFQDPAGRRVELAYDETLLREPGLKSSRLEFIRFLIAGGVNTGLTLLLFDGLRRLIPYLAAYTIAYTAGIGISYLLNAAFVFRQPKSMRTAALFPLVYVAQYLLGMLLMWLLVERAGFGPTVAAIAVVVVSVPVTFVLSRIVLTLSRN